MISILCGATIIFTAAWGAATLLRSASAATRHVVWTCALAAALLLLPLRWQLPHRAIAAVPVNSTIARVIVTPNTPQPVRTSRFPLETALFGIWATGTLLMTIRLLRSWLRIRAVVQNGRGTRPVLLSSEIEGPLVTGVFRAVILLPETSAGWTHSRKKSVLAHEAAHIRRGDPATLLLAHIATALYWFHPLCRLAAARLRAESERACDDVALAAGLRPSGYAGHLLELARKFNNQLAIPMATTSQLESRVKAILNPSTNRSFPARTVWCAAVLATAAMLAPLTTLTLHAQQAEGSATITGTVFDPTGARVPRAMVTATNADVNYEVSAVADPVGAYTFTHLPAGRYTIEVNQPGFTKFQAYPVLVNGGQMKVDASLTVSRLTISTVISADGPVRARANDASGPAGPIRVGGMVQAAKVIRMNKAVYPPDLQALGVEGTVVLRAIISKEGIPQGPTVVNSGANPQLVTAAMEAFRQWRFMPTQLNGETVETSATSQFDFKLK